MIDVLSSQLKIIHLKASILAILFETRLAPERLEFEITEGTLAHNLEAAQSILGGLRELGVRIAMNNFGAGYSNLYHLKNLKIDKVKIDSGSIRGMLLRAGR